VLRPITATNGASQSASPASAFRRGSFHSLVDLQAAINRYLEEQNADPKPVWTALPAAILAKLSECYV
jgi:hypothetical protein